jgi:uncharacterized protein YcbK (DUF882 family)
MRQAREWLRLWIAALFVVGTFMYVAALHAYGRAPAPQWPPEHSLHLFHTHTGERLDIVFRRGEEYAPEAIAKLDYFLRDHRTGEVRHFDPRIYDILDELTDAVGRPNGQIDIVCGYRTPWSNEFLRARTAGVAKNSLHLLAEAIDLRMPGVDTSKLRGAALSLHRGGVGYYPQSDFLHVDIGRVRQWCFNCGSARGEVNHEG